MQRGRHRTRQRTNPETIVRRIRAALRACSRSGGTACAKTFGASGDSDSHTRACRSGRNASSFANATKRADGITRSGRHSFLKDSNSASLSSCRVPCAGSSSFARSCHCAPKNSNSAGGPTDGGTGWHSCCNAGFSAGCRSSRTACGSSASCVHSNGCPRCDTRARNSRKTCTSRCACRISRGSAVSWFGIESERVASRRAGTRSCSSARRRSRNRVRNRTCDRILPQAQD